MIHSPLTLVDLAIAQLALISMRAVARKLANSIDARPALARAAHAFVNVMLAILTDDPINALALVTT